MAEIIVTVSLNGNIISLIADGEGNYNSYRHLTDIMGTKYLEPYSVVDTGSVTGKMLIKLIEDFRKG